MNYAKLLQDGHAECKRWDHGRDAGDEMSRYEYLADHIFEFTTYDGELSEEFGRKAVEVCDAINSGTTFDYIEDKDNYRWFILMCNMPFFADRINWGTSVRGAWWDTGYHNAAPTSKVHLSTCGLFDGDEQISELWLTLEQWKEFVAAIVAFGRGE